MVTHKHNGNISIIFSVSLHCVFSEMLKSSSSSSSSSSPLLILLAYYIYFTSFAFIIFGRSDEGEG